MSKNDINIHWDFKILADSEKEVCSVLEVLTKLLDLDIKSHNINEYPKFESKLFSLTVDSQLDEETTEVSDIRSLFHRIGEPIFVDERLGSEAAVFEAIFDSRKHIPAISEVFWAVVYAEKKIAVRKK